MIEKIIKTYNIRNKIYKTNKKNIIIPKISHIKSF